MSADALDLLLVGGGPALTKNVSEFVSAGTLGAGELHSVARLEQAIPLLDQRHFDGILFALEPPSASILDSISALDLACPETPIIVLASSTDVVLGELALRSGAQDCLTCDELDAGRLRRSIRFAMERKSKLAILADQALHDQLTGLPNRILLHDRLANMVARAKRYDTLVGVLFIDLDGFKAVNDSIGHAGGDKLLRAVGQRLRTCVRRGDTVARLGGDEFVVALENLRRVEDAAEVAATIHALLAEQFLIDEHPVQISASIGIAHYGPETNDVESLLRVADSGMYRAKRGKSSRPWLQKTIHSKTEG